MYGYPQANHIGYGYLKVRTYSLYIEVSNAPRQATYCEVIQVSPLLHQLLIQANQLPVDYQRADRDGALIDLLLYELEAAPALPLFIPLPHNTLLSKQCADFMEHPDIHSSPKDWAHDHNKSERTFHRWFKSETGLSFQAWRNRVCIIYALNALKKISRLRKLLLVWAMNTRQLLPQCSAKLWVIHLPIFKKISCV